MIDVGRWTLMGVVGAVLGLGQLQAFQRLDIEGRVEEAASPYADEGAEWVVRRAVGGRVLYAVDDPAMRLRGNFPGIVRLTVEVRPERIGSDVPLVLLQSVGARPVGAVTGMSFATDPARFAGADNGLYPSIDEGVVRLQVGGSGIGGGGEPVDSDRDGVPDSEDAFPNDPLETTDTDGDQIGNNADLDDENDMMPDIYELANGLDPLVDDSKGDLDGDGQPNGSEYTARTFANDATSVFRAAGIELEGSDARLRWSSRPGRLYRVLFTPDLRTPKGDPLVLASRIRSGGDFTTAVVRPPRGVSGFFVIQVEP